MNTLPSYGYGILLTKAHRILRAKVYSCLDEHGLIPTQWSLMGIVYEAKDGVTVSDVAEKIGVKAPLVTVMVDALVKKDIVARVSNKADGRSKLLLPTAHGKTLMKDIERSLSSIMSPLLDGVSQEEMIAFQKVLDTIIRNENVQ